MQPGVPPWHTPEEMQTFSNVVHRAEGILIIIVAVLALAEGLGFLRGRRTLFAWPAIISFAGLGLVGLLLSPHHGLDLAKEQVLFVWNDPQQRQHLFIGAVILLAGLAEIFSRKTAKVRQLWARAWPVALAIVGVSFLLHQQHGTGAAVAAARRIHTAIGAMLLISGAVRALELRTASARRLLRAAWPVALLIVGALLTIYQEPAGAYHSDH